MCAGVRWHCKRLREKATGDHCTAVVLDRHSCLNDRIWTQAFLVIDQSALLTVKVTFFHYFKVYSLGHCVLQELEGAVQVLEPSDCQEGVVRVELVGRTTANEYL